MQTTLTQTKAGVVGASLEGGKPRGARNALLLPLPRLVLAKRARLAPTRGGWVSELAGRTST
jgi:hypothetical protein